MCASQMVMQHWARKYNNILLKAGLRVLLLRGYVDDGCQGSTVLRRGMKFDQERSEFIFSEDQLEIDERENLPDNIRMAQRCLPAMNSVNENLKFTTEAPEDFPNKRLPTLDFMIWMIRGIIYHSYYEKTMGNQLTVMQRSAMSETQKMAILSNELVRRVSNIHRDVLHDELEGVIEHYISQLKSSGYNRKQARETVVCGIVGWRRKLERREKKGQKQYQEAKDTLEKRTDDQLLEKTTWYKGDRKRKRENKESKYQYRPPPTKRRRGKQQQGAGKKEDDKSKDKPKVKAVMFVPFTKHSELANRLRDNEEKMESMSGYRMKVVERGGSKLVDLLHKANPWAGGTAIETDVSSVTPRRKRERQTARTVRKETVCTKRHA